MLGLAQVSDKGMAVWEGLGRAAGVCSKGLALFEGEDFSENLQPGNLFIIL